MLNEPDEFAELVEKIRAGDERAAEELVRRYEPIIRREVRLRLHDRRLRRVFDSMDVCQSVLASFFVRAAVGQFELGQPGQLVKLLVSMARKKLVSNVRGQQRQRRDNRRVVAGDAEVLGQIAGGERTPSAIVGGQELLSRFRQGLSETERQLVEMRGEGLAWDEIAERLGGTAQSRRMQLARACRRMAKELGLEETDV